MLNLFPEPDETIEGVGRALRARETTCAAVLRRCLDRIEEWEPRVRAWVVVDHAGATEQARALDEELASGQCRGPLHGIPIGIKDIIDVKGLPTACGFEPWADRFAAEDAALVALLREAGAVILGKTVTTQFAWIDPPVTRNPWNLERTPGGSSSGSAAAVATGMCLGAIGTQTGGSIIRPASFCGVCGLKPTRNRIDDAGILPFAPSLDHPGPIARSVPDLLLLFAAIDPWHNQLNRATGEPTELTLGRLRGPFEERADGVMRPAFGHAVSTLARAGARVKEIALPDGFGEVHRGHRVIMASEAAAGHQRRLAEAPDEYRPLIRSLIEEGLAISAPEYIERKRHQERISQAMKNSFEEAEALIAPATIGPAPDVSTTGDPVLNSPWSYTELPTISLPFGLSPDGLPLALQLVAAYGSEADLFRVARWCENVLRGAFRARKD